MSITAAMVKELRERTGAGMMDCKKALQETSGDMDAAITYLREKGIAKAAKRAARTAAEGVIVMASTDDGTQAFMAEINSETDFVAKDENFRQFADNVAKLGLQQANGELDTVLAADYGDGQTVEQARAQLVQKIGENINIRRTIKSTTNNGVIGAYLHGSRIGVLVELDHGDAELAKDIAMHIAASNPQAIDKDGVAPEIIANEREIFIAQARESGKPDDIIEKMVTGRIAKFLKEVCLVDQLFVKDPDTTISKLLAKHNAKVLAYHRFEVGEGIEKNQVDFAEEVRAQVEGS